MISSVTIIVMMIIAIFIIVSIQTQKHQQTALAFHAFNKRWGFTDRGFKQLIKEDPRVNASLRYIEVKALNEIQNCERASAAAKNMTAADYDLQRICRNNMLYYTGLCLTHSSTYTFAFCNNSTLIKYLKENGYLREGQELQDVGTVLGSYIGSYKDTAGNDIENMTNRGGYNP
jgi:hypothetical protein